jgi:hypothetical protein
LGPSARATLVIRVVFDHELEHVTELNHHLDLDDLDIDDVNIDALTAARIARSTSGGP